MNIAIFASGGGSNAAVIINTLHSYIDKQHASISLVVTNNEKAPILGIAGTNHIPTEIINFKNTANKNEVELYAAVLKKHDVDFIILAGYLKKLPKEITTAYRKKIVNIHPALLPAYGGVGMYGKYVHEAVIAAGEKESGITIHYVDEVYDHGQIIFQTTCVVEKNDTPESLATKILSLEHAHYTKVISEVLLSQIPVK